MEDLITIAIVGTLFALVIWVGVWVIRTVGILSILVAIISVVGFVLYVSASGEDGIGDLLMPPEERSATSEAHLGKPSSRDEPIATITAESSTSSEDLIEDEEGFNFWIIAAIIAAILLCAALQLQIDEGAENGKRKPREAKGYSGYQTDQRTGSESWRANNAPQEIVIDGTNVIFWDGDADLTTLALVIGSLEKRNFRPVVFFDASTRHHLKQKDLNKAGFAAALCLPLNQVTVCPAETEADAFLLKFAQSESLPVISNDRFRDRASQTRGLKIVKGVIVNGRPIFDGL